MPDVLALPAPTPPPRELGTRVRWCDRMTLAVLVDQYGREAIDRALDDIRASKLARDDTVHTGPENL